MVTRPQATEKTESSMRGPVQRTLTYMKSTPEIESCPLLWHVWRLCLFGLRLSCGHAPLGVHPTDQAAVVSSGPS